MVEPHEDPILWLNPDEVRGAMNEGFFVVGRMGDSPFAWELLGLYDNREQAENRCICPEDFVGPVSLNVDLPEEKVDWPGIYFPTAEEVEDE